MKTRTNLRSNRQILAAFPFLLMMICSSLSGIAQKSLKGKVVYEKDSRPVPNATISLLKQQRFMVSDAGGNFVFPEVRANDTLMITSVGYQAIKMPVSIAMSRSEFPLTEYSRTLAPVVVKFNSEQVLGTQTENFIFFRGWNTDRTGGEMGKVVRVPHKEYKLDKVRFKINNLCDTCLIRLRVREVVNGYPGKELVTDSISMKVNTVNINDKRSPEFELGKYNIVLTQPYLFIGLEVLGCNKGKLNCGTFSFIGTETGDYVYKSTATSE